MIRSTGDKRKAYDEGSDFIPTAGNDKRVKYDGEEISGKSKFFLPRGFESVVSVLEEKKNILILCGAGLSVSCGIPDFRSKDGLYNTLNFQGLGLTCAEDLFDMEFFREDPKPFFTFARKHFYNTATIEADQRSDDSFSQSTSSSNVYEPSISHYFISQLQKKKKLLRIYTQNIDGLEETAGVSPKKIVYAHGSMKSSSCMKCMSKIDTSEIEKDIINGNIPYCKRPPKKKRSSECGQFCGGVIKPNITFFGEKLNNDVHKALQSDKTKVDAILVIGTSLSVSPMSKVIDWLPKNVPRILINRTDVKLEVSSSSDSSCVRDGYTFDACLLGDCDIITKSISDALGWILTPQTQNNCVQHIRPERITSEDCNSKLGRTFLFPGAIFNLEEEKAAASKSRVDNDGTASETTIVEVVHCDECGKQIHCDNRKSHYDDSCAVMKCVECFDYDLCVDCWKKPEIRTNHFGGTHIFVRE